MAKFFRLAVFVSSAFLTGLGTSLAADSPAASVASGDLARRLALPESKVSVVASENGTGGSAVVSLQVPSKGAKPTHRYTLKPVGPSYQVERVDYADGRHDEYEYGANGRLAAVKQFGRQGKLVATARYEYDANSGRDRIASVLRRDWTKPQYDFVDSYDVYRYAATGALEKVEKFPNESATKPENIFATVYYEGAPGLEKPARSVDRRGMPTEYVYQDGALVRTKSGDKTVADYAVNEFGEPALQKTTDYRGMETVYTYDSRGALVKTAAGDGTVTDFVTLGDRSLPSKITEAIGRVTRFDYDAEGVLVKKTTLDEKGGVLDEVNYSYGGDAPVTTDTLVRVPAPAGAAPAAAGEGSGVLRGATSSDGFKYAYTQIQYIDVVASATDPKGNTKTYSYDDLARPSRVVHRDASGTLRYVDRYEYAGRAEGLPSPNVKRYADEGGTRLVGTLKHENGRPARFEFADGRTLVYEGGFAREVRRGQDVLLKFRNKTLEGGTLTGYDVTDASGKALGSFAPYEDPADAVASLAGAGA